MEKQSLYKMVQNYLHTITQYKPRGRELETLCVLNTNTFASYGPLGILRSNCVPTKNTSKLSYLTKPQWLVSWLDDAGQQVLQPMSLENKAILKEMPLVCWCQNILLRGSSAKGWVCALASWLYRPTAPRVQCWLKFFRLTSFSWKEKANDTFWMAFTSIYFSPFSLATIPVQTTIIASLYYSSG